MIGIFRTPRRMEDLALFAHHLSGAMTARVPLPDVLRSYSNDSESLVLSKVSDRLAERVEAGIPLSEALDEQSVHFPPAFRRLVRLGEEGHVLGGVMGQLAKSLQQNLRTYEHFRRAAIYPLMVCVILFISVGFIMAKIVPRFTAVASEIGIQLPGLLKSQALMDGTVAFILLLMLICIGFLLASVLGLRMRWIYYGRMMFMLPLVGPVMRRAETARFAHNLSLLLRNRLPLHESLQLLAESSENRYTRLALEEFRSQVELGSSLSEIIAKQPLFPAPVSTMIAAAEDHGQLAESLDHIGDYYSERTAHGLNVLREMFEPILLLLIGLLVALIMTSLYIPLFSIASSAM